MSSETPDKYNSYEEILHAGNCFDDTKILNELTESHMTKHYLQIERNSEGDKLAIMSPIDENGESTVGYRIAGPKAWGGSTELAGIEISTNDLVSYIKDFAPDVLERLASNCTD